ncbi:MAG: hypothetical protein JWO30_1585 [Fibrobacteres bacterium]|nr:hypothetical protein [Fibrobacterota bacterium]
MIRLNAARWIFAACCSVPWSAQALDYRFDSTISKPVLENYLDKSISFTELLHDDFHQARNARGVDPKDNIRFLINTGAKYVGRAIMLWGGESNLGPFTQHAKPYIDTLHSLDPDIIFEAAVFEYVSNKVETVAIPARVFTEFGQPVVTRNFKLADIIYSDGQSRGGIPTVPDMNKLEARMWFYFLSTSYIDIGVEAIHFGQVGLMNQNDKGNVGWLDMMTKVRDYAHQHARRHMVICNAHTSPGRGANGVGGYVAGGKLLFDCHAFPLRIAETVGQPYKATLKINYSDGLFRKSMGGVTPSGWSCTHLPYLVEFDNFGSNGPGTSGKDPFVWGWDEITWFAQLAEAERNAWLKYAVKWVHDSDSVGHVQMPGSRTISGYPGGMNWYWANTKSAACPNGWNTEATIKEIWAGYGGTVIRTDRRSVLSIAPLNATDAFPGFSADGRWHAPGWKAVNQRLLLPE